MTQPHELRGALLREDGLRDGQIGPETRKEIRDMITRETKRITRLRWGTGVSTALMLLAWIAGATIEANAGGGPRPAAIGALAMIAMAFFWITLFLGGSLLWRQRSLRLWRIEAMLADLSQRIEALARRE